jgi:hypothetical protein
MLIDGLLLRHDVAAKYEVDVRAPSGYVYQAVRKLDLSASRVVRTLFRLREFPGLFRPLDAKQRLGLTLDGLLQSGFILLADKPPDEIVLGVAGRFWTASGCIQKLDASGFLAFNEPGYAKAVWNFTLSDRGSNLTRLATETRVLCLDEESRKRFRLYWALIGPFSGLIRKEALKAVRKEAESSCAADQASQATNNNVD